MSITMATTQYSVLIVRGGATTCDNPEIKHGGRNNGQQEILQLLLATTMPIAPSAFHIHWALVAIATDHMSNNSL